MKNSSLPVNSLVNDKITKFFNGNYSEEEELYVNDIFCDKAKTEELRSFLSEQFNELPTESKTKERNLDHILHKINYEINNKKQPQKTLVFDIILKWGFRVASLIIIPLLIYSGIQTVREEKLKRETWVEIKAPAWTRAQFSLPDGTTGWLNSNSSIKYSGNFNLDRKVTLNGEALFDVFKDKSRPFEVKTNDVVLKVLGTRFNVSSYENEKTVEVVLEEGSLVFSDINKDKTYTMIPNDLVVYDKIAKNYSKETVQSQKYLSWTEGKLVFRNDPLDIILRRLERWYNIDVEVNVDMVEELRLRATFTDENLEEVLDLLKQSLPIDYKILNGNLGPDKVFAKKKVIIFPRLK